MIAEEIIATAEKYIGKYEKPNNSGFKDADFEKKMAEVGWQKGHAWCCYFCELVWKEAYKNKDIVKRLDKLFNASSTATFKNFDLADDFETGKKPKPGALAVFRYGNDWRGHIGIVTKVVDKSAFNTIEGNTNDQGGREGVMVQRKVRFTDKPFNPRGLNLVGFIYPKEV